MLDSAFILHKRPESELTEVTDSRWVQSHSTEAKFKSEVTASESRIRPMIFATESSFLQLDDTAKFCPIGGSWCKAEKYQL